MTPIKIENFIEALHLKEVIVAEASVQDELIQLPPNHTSFATWRASGVREIRVRSARFRNWARPAPLRPLVVQFPANRGHESGWLPGNWAARLGAFRRILPGHAIQDPARQSGSRRWCV